MTLTKMNRLTLSVVAPSVSAPFILFPTIPVPSDTTGWPMIPKTALFGAVEAATRHH